MRAVDESDAVLLCEGYLDKRRGFLQTRTRWFRATSVALSFYEWVESERERKRDNRRDSACMHA